MQKADWYVEYYKNNTNDPYSTTGALVEKDSETNVSKYNMAGGYVYGISVNGKQILNLNPYKDEVVTYTEDGQTKTVTLKKAQPPKADWSPWDQVEYYSTLNFAGTMVGMESERRVLEDNNLHKDDVKSIIMSETPDEKGDITTTLIFNDENEISATTNISSYVSDKINEEAAKAKYGDNTTIGDAISINTNAIANNKTEIDNIKKEYVQKIEVSTDGDTIKITQTGNGGEISFTDEHIDSFTQRMSDEGLITTEITTNAEQSYKQQINISPFVNTQIQNNAAYAYVTIDNNKTTIEKAIQNTTTEAKKHTTVAAGENIVVNEVNTDGQRHYTISTADNVEFTTVNVGNAVNITNNGIDMGDTKITNVQDGEVSATSKDAVNGSQLYKEQQDRIAGDNMLSNRVDALGSRINKVGASAAALAALHPMDFDPDDKLSFAAGVGNYAGENAAALGMFYRPDEKVMFSLSGTMGNGENMVNAGISFALDRRSNVNNSKVAMAHEIQDLREQVAQLTALVNQIAGVDMQGSGLMFPDVPENHWAYDYIEKLAAAGIVEGYPDGNFSGDRTMTRYEYAAMLYRALEKGFAVDERLLGEFEAELGRISIDRISGADSDKNKVERVRVIADKDRDVYGGKI